MAKNDNFQNFITDIADALRIRYNTTDNFDPHEYCTKILELSGLTNCNDLHYLEIEYEVDDVTSEVKLFNNLTNFTKIFIDDVEYDIDLAPQNFLFTTYGKHYIDVYGLDEIPTSAFSECHNIIGVSIPQQITKIGNYAFHDCDNLSILLMSDFVETIGEHAFCNSHELQRVEISSGITSIGDYAFYGCSSLTELICNAETQPTIGSHTFQLIGESGTLYHPIGADYTQWISVEEFYLGYYGWKCREFHTHDEIQSVQQYVTHIGNTIRKAKRFGSNVLINPQDFYYHILSTDLQFINGKEAIPGDVAIYCKHDEKIHIIHQDYYRPELFPSEYYSPVGTVVIPYGHTDDGTIRIVSLKAMSTVTPESGTFDMPGIWFGPNGNVDGMTNYNTYRYTNTPFPTNSNSFTTVTYTDTNQSYSTSCVLGVIGEPFGMYLTQTKVSTTPSVYYSTWASASKLVALPYQDDVYTKNDYYSFGVFSDMDGRGNTDKWLAARGEKDYTTWKPGINTEEDYPIVSCCDMYYTDGTKQGDWYLPAMGELTYLLPYANRINNGIKLLGGIGYEASDLYYLWSSTPINEGRISALDVPAGGIVTMYRQYGFIGGYAFLSLNPDDTVYQGEHNITDSVIEDEDSEIIDNTIPADVVLYDIENDEKIVVDGSTLERYGDTSKYSPIGVVVVPSEHDVYGDGTCGVMSLKTMSVSNPKNGSINNYNSSINHVYMYWGPEGNNSLLSDFNKVVITTTNTENEILDGTQSYGHLPSNKTTKQYSASTISCYSDDDVFYSSASTTNMIPSPYLSDDARNLSYYNTSVTTANALSDFDGRGNSDSLLVTRGEKDYTSWLPEHDSLEDYPAVSCCDMYYTDGTEQGDWYLPAMGELGYIMPKWNQIQAALKKINTVFDPTYNSLTVKLNDSHNYWSSSECSNYSARSLGTGSGTVYCNGKSDSHLQTRAFLRVVDNRTT